MKKQPALTGQSEQRKNGKFKDNDLSDDSKSAGVTNPP